MARGELSFWWWGEDEAPGLGAWLTAVCEAFERRTGIVVQARLLRHDEVIPGFPTAAEAGNAPDLHFFWNGIYLVENVWRGYLAPLDDLLEPDEIAAFGGGPQSTVDGAVYRAAWYAIPVVWVANRALLAGVGADVPTTWEECETAAARLREAGQPLLAVGDGEGDLSVWWLTHFLAQHVREASDAPRLALGELDWNDPLYRRAWELLADARAAGWFDEDALALTLWEGLGRFAEGAAAMTLASGPMFTACRRRLGEAATVVTAPQVGDGPLARLPIVDTQGVGIWVGSRQKERATDLLRFMHEPDRLRALWETTRLFPADRRWQPEELVDPDYRRMWEWFTPGPNVPYLPNLLPLELHFRVCAAVGQEILAGTLDAREAGVEARTRAAAWRERADTSPYRAWALAAAAAPGF